jgi:hypothetical protein
METSPLIVANFDLERSTDHDYLLLCNILRKL